MTVFTDVTALMPVESVTMSWTAATEAGGFAGVMQYEGQYSSDGGANWSTLFPLQAGLTYTWPLSSIPAPGTYLVRVRAYDGQDYGPYATSASFVVGLMYSCPSDPAAMVGVEIDA